MVLGFIDFLLGGKRNTKMPKGGQVANPVMGSQEATAVADPANKVPNGVSNPTENVSTPQFVPNKAAEPVSSARPSLGGSSVSEIISKIHKELKTTTDRISELVSEIKTVEGTVSSLGHKIDDLEESKKVHEEKLSEINANMSKFLSLYELINNQYNPFVDQAATSKAAKTVMVNADGSSATVSVAAGGVSTPSVVKEIVVPRDELSEALLDLDTLNIETAAADCVPLTRIKNSTNSLVVILSWMEYLIKKVGIEESRNALRYYTEILRWITPEVFFELDKYLRGMKDNPSLKGNERLTVRDHIVSLYFLSKLNEKVLDEKLTRAVLQLIKE